ncbi:MAG: hypothetical protein AB8G18_14135 [Gammaproteobacteria bacterium]
MTIRHILQLSILITVSATFVIESSHAQADPAWLKSWAEAQERRPAVLVSHSTIATEDEPGTPLVINGTVLQPNGTPASDVIVHAYHRDHDGFELGTNDREFTTWELQGWIQTDVDGKFQFKTIRPAPDHLHREGAHLHFTLESEEFGRQWATKIFLSDDPAVTKEMKLRSKEQGLFGAVRDIKIVDGVQSITVRFKFKETADF